MILQNAIGTADRTDSRDYEIVERNDAFIQKGAATRSVMHPNPLFIRVIRDIRGQFTPDFRIIGERARFGVGLDYCGNAGPEGRG
jgi:hypothetical protein